MTEHTHFKNKTSKANDKNSGAALKWRSERFGTSVATVPGHELGFVVNNGAGTSWAEVPYEGKPNRVSIKLDWFPRPDVTALFVARDRVTKLEGNTITFHVDLRWQGPENRFPSTNIPGNWNNEDRRIIFCDRAGNLAQVEYSLNARDTKLIAAEQLLYLGRMARTNVTAAQKAGLRFLRLKGVNHVATVVPTAPEFAHPHGGFLNSWGEVASEVIRMLHAENRIVGLSEIEPAKWAPPAIVDPPEEGRICAPSEFFNFPWGNGKLARPDEKGGYTQYHVNFRQLTRKCGYVLKPMHLYTFRPKETDKGWLALNVRPVE